jgi:aryl-alcohol dehydrogenase-like predicted oxidoreductase
MEKRKLGRTDLMVSRLTFGCGAVGGLMTKGDPADQDRAVAWARDNGINHFDTAPLYGNGASEENLNRALGANREGLVISTKVRLLGDDRKSPEAAVMRSIDESLRRLGQDHVDLFQLHNTLGTEDDDECMTSDEVLERVVPAFEKVRDAGKTRYLGFTAKGDSDMLLALVNSGAFDTGQIFFNLLNPSPVSPLPPDYPAQDFKGLLKVCDQKGVGSIGVRVLAGGALSGSTARHPVSMQDVAPIGSAPDFETDAANARRFSALVAQGHAGNLAELAIRFAVSTPELATTEIGIATMDELQQAARAVEKGPLPPEALAEIERIRATL